MMNNILPVELQLEILSYVPHLDKLEYARCNRLLCCELMARVRIITIRQDQIEYFNSESFRNKILGLIVDPYKQLDLPDYCNDPFNPLEYNLLFSKLILRTLETDMNSFPLLLPHITQVQHLYLNWDRRNTERTMPQISGLRELTLFGCNTPLTWQLDLRYLRYLRIQYFNSVSDVRCLDHIHELHLVYCADLVDISCLNNNKIIVIDSCPVRDYSKSFRFSTMITVLLSKNESYGNHTTIKGINLDYLEAVQSLTIDFDQMNVDDPLSERDSLPSSLHYLSLRKLKSQLLIPLNHCLKELTISECQKVSLQNLEKIRCVKINRCHEIIDWSPLQDNKNVEISFCDGFKSGKQLGNVKRLTFIHTRLDNMEDLTNITDLQLDKFRTVITIEPQPYIKSSAQGNQLFSSAINLQEIDLDIDLNYPDISLLSSIMKSPKHKRIIISLFQVDKSNLDNFCQMIEKNFGRFYEVGIKPPWKLVLLKREQPKKDEASLFSYFIPFSLGIMPILAYFIAQR